MFPFHHREADRPHVVSWHSVVSEGLKDCVVIAGADLAAQRGTSAERPSSVELQEYVLSFVSVVQLAQVLVRIVPDADSSC